MLTIPDQQLTAHLYPVFQPGATIQKIQAERSSFRSSSAPGPEEARLAITRVLMDYTGLNRLFAPAIEVRVYRIPSL